MSESWRKMALLDSGVSLSSQIIGPGGFYGGLRLHQRHLVIVRPNRHQHLPHVRTVSPSLTYI